MKQLMSKDVLKKSVKELVKMRNTLRKELFEMRLKNSLRSLNQTHLIRLARKNIARVNTALTKKIQEPSSSNA